LWNQDNGLPFCVGKSNVVKMIDIYESIYSYIKKKHSKKRQKHSFEVSKLAESLCSRYDIDPGKGRIAGIAHDIARNFHEDKLAAYAGRDGRGISPEESALPILLHGRAGAEFIKETWDVQDRDILEAVRNHTCGKPGMCLLSRILFVADYLEPGRKFLPEDKRLEVLSVGLDEMVLFVLKGKFAHLKKKGREILPDSLLLFKEVSGE
jgi:predicted HD superfamily hydrolase involved in NAD metabolism